MNIEQIEKRNQAIIDNATEWANDRDCFPLERLDIAIIGDCLDMKIPAAFYNFESSESRNRAKITGATKAIFKTLDRIADKLKEMEG